MANYSIYKAILYTLFFIGSLAFYPSLALATDESKLTTNTDERMVRAIILKIEPNLQTTNKQDHQIVGLEILEGKHRNQKIITDFYASGHFSSIILRQGDEVFVNLTLDTSGTVKQASIIEIARDKILIYLLLAFFGTLLVIGGFKGLRVVLTLISTYFIVLNVLLPLIIKGYDPIYVTVGLGSVITIVTLLMVGGINRKTFAAIIGTISGLLIKKHNMFPN